MRQQPQKQTLEQAIQMYTPEPLTEMDMAESVRNLTGFFGLLLQIDREQKERRNDSNIRSEHQADQA